MAELTNRMEREAEFAKGLARVSSRHRKELIRLMGEPPDPSKVPESFWRMVEDEQKAQLAVFLLLLMQDSSEQHLGLLLPGDLNAVASESLPDRAAVWANARASRVATDYVTNSRAQLERLQRRWYGADLHVGGIRIDRKPPPVEQVQSGALEIFGPVRDARIATSETTIAATAGTNDAIGQATDIGFVVTVTWYCELDGRECPFCGALHRQRMKDWESVLIAADAPERVIDEVRANGGPTAHAGCRCWLEVRSTPREVTEAWDSSKHPRDPGGEGGGQFVSKGGGSGPAAFETANNSQVGRMLDGMSAKQMQSTLDHLKAKGVNPEAQRTIEYILKARAMKAKPKTPIADKPAAIPTSSDVMQAMRGLEAGADRGALVGLRDLRKEFPKLTKEQFDTAILGAARDGKISLHYHDYPASLTAAERSELVFHAHADSHTSFGGTFYVGAAIRQKH